MTLDQLNKLPKWAQDHIKDLTRQRDEAIRELNRYVDGQTKSPFYTEDFSSTGEQQGPTFRRRYIQADNIHVVWRGVKLDISAHDHGCNGHGIRLHWEGLAGRTEDVAFIPSSFQSARIVSKEDMR